MAKLNQKARNDVQSLLEDYQKIEDALEYGPRRRFEAVLCVMDAENNESFEVNLRWDIAKHALISAREWTTAELKKHGIEIG